MNIFLDHKPKTVLCRLFDYAWYCCTM